jgi:hypothetical protein
VPLPPPPTRVRLPTLRITDGNGVCWELHRSIRQGRGPRLGCAARRFHLLTNLEGYPQLDSVLRCPHDGLLEVADAASKHRGLAATSHLSHPTLVHVTVRQNVKVARHITSRVDHPLWSSHYVAHNVIKAQKLRL